jgi:dual specificity tyrosine-phosphorylation-regulated kinase 2/3/4
MWSLGCIIAELFTGFPIFPGENEQEQLACIMEILGLPERHMVEKCSRKKNFFGEPSIDRSVMYFANNSMVQ